MRQRLEPEERGSEDFHNAVYTEGNGRVRLTCVSDLLRESSGAAMPWQDVPRRISAVRSNITMSVHSTAGRGKASY